MKRLLLGFLMLAPMAQSQAQLAIAQVIQAGIKRVIKAVDLRIQRLQNKTIWLQTTQKKIENWMSKLQLQQIAGWSERQGELYAGYYQELRQVKSVLHYYQQIQRLAELQRGMLHEYQRAWKNLGADPLFSAQEKSYMQRVYQGMLKSCLEQVDLLAMLLEPFSTQMTDAERLSMLQQAGHQMEKQYGDMRVFNSQNAQLRAMRAASMMETGRVKKIYGIN